MAIQDDAKNFLLSALSRAGGDLPSLQLEWLATQGYTRGTIDDRWQAYLAANAYYLPEGLSRLLVGLNRAIGNNWTPNLLFQSGDILLWYDPSDLSTMFKDTAGTQPVTADGDSVALMLDKGQWGGKTLEQVLAGQTPNIHDSFDSYADVDALTAVWPIFDPLRGTASLTSATLRLTNDGTGTMFLSREYATVVGRRYRFTSPGTISAGTARARIQAGATSGTSALGTSAAPSTGAHDLQFDFTATGTTTHLGVLALFGSGSATHYAEFSELKLQEIPGYHRTQATGTSMPKYKTGPNPAAAENSPELVTNGGFSSGTTGWTGSAATLAVVSGELEVTNSADAAGYAEVAAFTTVSGRSYRITGTARRGTSSSITINVRAAGGASYGNLTLTNTVNQDFEFTFTATSTSSTIWLQSNQAVTGRTAYFDDISVKEIPASAPYIHWLLYDGTDDGHATGTITWGTDEVAICAGVTKSSDAAATVFAEFSTSASANNGAFAVYAPGTTAAANYLYRQRGSATSDASYTNAAIAAPVTSVLTGSGKISTDLAALRINGVEVATAATDQGSGNFGSHALNFGRRNNASLPFNGREYQTVIRSRLLSASELSKLETFVAAKTGVVLP